MSNDAWKYFVTFLVGVVLSAIMFVTVQNLNDSVDYHVVPIERVDSTLINIANTSTDITKSDLRTYQRFSERMVNDISDAVVLYSEKWNIPIGLTHSMMRIESEYKFWVEHAPINIKVHGKRINTKAIGLGGIVWEFWADSLRKHNIAHERTDLFLYDVNIEASTAILRWIVDSEINKPYINERNLINRIIKRYYGAYDKDYHNKMIKVTSDLWLKRIARTLIETQEYPDTLMSDTLKLNPFKEAYK